MPSKGRYTAGKQVSRWEADSENIDIEYKNLESQTNVQNCTNCTNCTCQLGERKSLVIKLLFVVVVFGVGLVLGYLVRKSVPEEDNIPIIVSAPASKTNDTSYSIQQDYNRAFSKLIQDDLEDVINYEDHLKTLTKYVHMSGVGSTNRVITYVRRTWMTYPFDAVHIKRYNVSLSYPNYTNIGGNSVTVQTENGTLIFRTQYNMTNRHPDYLPFNAYSPSGTVTTDNVVYAHYGRQEDFEELRRQNVSVNGSLLIVRYGRIHPASKVKNAEGRGARGVILYSDPADYTNNQSSVFPETWWLPSWAVQLSHVRYDLVGDPKTPDYSSIAGVYGIPDSSANFPTIPVQPIRYTDAKFLLSQMVGPIVSNEWFGGLNITYRLGPGYSDGRKVQLSVENSIQHRNISNIIAVIKGHFETDKYVIVGAHIDAWEQGAVDSGTGYSVLQELARTFSYHVEKGWKPRRTIIFALWDASKYGHIGAYEWVQEYERQLIAGAVAYINLDSLIHGNYSFSASASAMLHSVIMKATQTVPVNCSSTIRNCSKDNTVFDTWLRSFPDPGNPNSPRFEILGDSSDHAPFVYRIGVPTLCPHYTYNKNMYPNLPSYPAYGTLDDSVDYLLNFIDSDYSFHIRMTKVLADVVLRLSDSAVLPFDIETFIRLMRQGREVMYGYGSVLKSVGAELDALNSTIETFCNAANQFNLELKNATRTINSEFDLYLLNDRLIQLPRAFITDVGLPGQPQYRNVLVAPDPEDLSKEVIFPGITRTLITNRDSELGHRINEQIAYLIVSLKRATDIMTNGMVTR